MKIHAGSGGDLGLVVRRNITLVITSCRRFDLLKRTVDSMRPWVTGFGQKIIAEDSEENPLVLDRLRQEGFSVLVNGRQLGQHASIDRAYAAVKTPYVFHCEDDRVFSREPDFASAIQVLDCGFPEGNVSPGAISCVCFYDMTAKNIFDQGKYREYMASGTRYRYSPDQKNKYNAFTFTPSLLRHDLWTKYGPWKEFVSEGSIARFLQRRGYAVATQQPGVVTHIGGNRHIPDRLRHSTPMRAVRQWLRKGV